MPVADANVFIRGKRTPFDSALTVPEVMDELESDSARRKFDFADVSVMNPSEESIEKVREKSEELNSPTSKIDEKLLALALDVKQAIVTDDKALQNLALHLEVEFEAYMTDGIDEKKRWEEYCPNCGRKVAGRCDRCGQKSTSRLV
ncbi:NOB1 family endonuclease [Candidatus Nanohalococcus occultus]|uniref:Endonuclease Nob1, consists of a PIN domain and a Zn-ribbon module n=1 Tax=Candidatus Nanohalococcus occultus TaxID=2978047 RepID=A0ABY8CET2_9ARCH|nr:Endonuclease Nob1, consists of a PIN domain and a Zn-ribbon module [Candidatus Nanohaloarchaeota archaeon SVXNc]